MVKYVLNYYNLGDESGICFESEDPDRVIREALHLCSNDNGRYTYRMETWENGEMVGGWRFFQDGKEFTQEIISSVLGS